MQNKKGNAAIRVVIALLTLGVIIGVFAWRISENDKKYWESQGESWKRDCEFFDIKDFDPTEYKTQDGRLSEAAQKLLKAVGSGEEFDGEIICIDKENTEHLQTDSFKYLRAFYVVQIDDKAAVTFQYSDEQTEFEKAVERCEESYKTYPYDKIYLEKKNGQWTVTDVFRAA